MIGYYVHHHGRGHLHRAEVLCAALDEPVTALSSLPRPASWAGDWVRLPPDDAGTDPVDVTARGALHWAPLHDHGVRHRAHVLSTWLARHRPRLLVADVSVETALLARLHGVPVVTVLQPGRRDDGPHRLGRQVSSALVAAWPAAARGMSPGLGAEDRVRLHHLGAVSRLPITPPSRRPQRAGAGRVVVLQGRGDAGVPAPVQRRMASQAPDWRWTFLGGDHGTWVDDPSALLRDADVVVTHAGQSALADVAAARRPAVVFAAPRPFDEQACTVAALARDPWPAVAVPTLPDTGWDALLRRAAALDGEGWAPWCDGEAPRRFAEVVATLSARTPVGA